MPNNWNSVLSELQDLTRGPHDALRRKYLKQLHGLTGRNVLVYYSGWLQKPGARGFDMSIGDADKTGFMTCSAGVDRQKGLDLILHTPGGDVAATESIIDYLHALYQGNVRAIIPQLAMSGGTLMALSCQSIVMGKQSSLGPVDPQIMGMPAQGVLEEFNRAVSECKADPAKIAMWQPIISKYWPTMIGSCQHAVDWSDQLLRKYLTNCMFSTLPAPTRRAKINKIANLLGKQSTSKSHNRHISTEKAKELGLVVEDLEANQDLQDAVLNLHHALTITFSQTMAVKLIENHDGVAFVSQAQLVPATS